MTMLIWKYLVGLFCFFSIKSYWETFPYCMNTVAALRIFPWNVLIISDISNAVLPVSCRWDVLRPDLLECGLWREIPCAKFKWGFSLPASAGLLQIPCISVVFHDRNVCDWQFTVRATSVSSGNHLGYTREEDEPFSFDVTMWYSLFLKQKP